DEPQELACDGSHDLLLGLAGGQELAVAVTEPMLGFPGDLLHRLALPTLSCRQGFAEAGPVAIAPGCLDHDTPQMSVAGFADGTAADACPTGVLARDRSAVTHQLPR